MQPGDVEETAADTSSLEKWINFAPNTPRKRYQRLYNLVKIIINYRIKKKIFFEYLKNLNLYVISL